MRFRWSILVLTQPSRTKFVQRLLDALDPQVEKFNDVHVDVRMFDRNLSLGENREIMRRDSTGEYICFFDDDDMPAEDYVGAIHQRLDGVDYIGFQLQCYRDGVPDLPTFHSLRHSAWTSDQQGHYRDISHLNPMRRELALKIPLEGGVAEDFRWAAAMRATGLVKTEHYIDRVMYHYYYRTVKIGDLPYVVKNKTEKEIRLEELDHCDLQLGSWIGSVRNYLDGRRASVQEIPLRSGREAKIRQDELSVFEKFLDSHDYGVSPERLYIQRRREEIGR